jgi:hypothetical protein
LHWPSGLVWGNALLDFVARPYLGFRGRGGPPREVGRALVASVLELCADDIADLRPASTVSVDERRLCVHLVVIVERAVILVELASWHVEDKGVFDTPRSRGQAVTGKSAVARDPAVHDVAVGPPPVPLVAGRLHAKECLGTTPLAQTTHEP